MGFSFNSKAHHSKSEPGVDSGARELCMWMLDKGYTLPANPIILLILTGGGYEVTCQISMSNSSQGEGYIEPFACPNLGTKYLQKLLRLGSDWCSEYDEKILYAAIEASNTEAFFLLVQYLDLGKADRLFQLALEKETSIARWLVENTKLHQDTALFCADLQLLLYLQEKGFSLDGHAYKLPIRNGDWSTVKALYASGVDWQLG